MASVEHADCTFKQLRPLGSVFACLFQHDAVRSTCNSSLRQQSIINEMHLVVVLPRCYSGEQRFFTCLQPEIKSSISVFIYIQFSKRNKRTRSSHPRLQTDLCVFLWTWGIRQFLLRAIPETVLNIDFVPVVHVKETEGLKYNKL
jgi:hypothetical protein